MNLLVKALADTKRCAVILQVLENALVTRVNRRTNIRIVTGHRRLDMTGHRRLPLTTWRANVEAASLTHNGVTAGVVSRAAEKVIMDLGKSVVIKGELSASEDLTLFGQMEGSVMLPDHTLTIGPAANIKASISAKAVVIMGAVTGNVTAGEKVEIGATGSVTGDLASPSLVIAEGAHLRGKVQVPLAG